MERTEIHVLGASPAPDAGFIADPDRLEPQPDKTPFDRMWLSPERDWSSYSKLYVAVVDVSHVLPMSWWDKVNIRKTKVGYDLPLIARRVRGQLIEAFRNDPRHRFQVLDDPAEIDADTAVLELALVQLVPNKAVLGVIGLAAWGGPLEIGIPVATATAFIAHGATAMEARVCDGVTGEEIAAFADRETGRTRVIDLRSLTWYGNTLEDSRIWAQTLVQLANDVDPREVDRPADFTIKPW